ncbi:TIGR04086 family membrane protein [Arthrobacter gengyunqii]|uniref:TIGR04086 family membrane protein n=1 Tax=Arthrobacter gengyunqii TaxID=2886940 RepID=A0ABS8GHD3_9MICC|nr:TIGR04086 family membrane protein [Arthrobacter gengyunqii]MCC3266054.1 TIGR04086 family membrane protein [Arthrobacter gengyunqii]
MSTSAGATGQPARKPNRAATGKGAANPAARDGGTDSREQVVGREKEQFGGVKIGSAFFGWLAAAGTTVLLSAIATAFGAALLANNVDAGEAAADPQGAGVAGVILLMVILFVAYFCGGYVAGRMARFNGLMQGVAVWIWGIVIALVLALIGAIASSELDINAQLNTYPQLSGDNMTAAIISAVIAALVALGGAILGGLAGMRFHRRVDRAGLGD